MKSQSETNYVYEEIHGVIGFRQILYSCYSFIVI